MIEWLKEHGTTIVDAALVVVMVLVKIGLIIVCSWVAALTAQHVLMQAGANPDQGVLWFSTAFAIPAIVMIATVIDRGVRGFVQRAGERRSGLGMVMFPTRLPSSQHDLAVVVQHEARHAVIADVLGYTVNSIETRMRPDVAGNVSWAPPEGMSLEDQRWAQALIALAPAGVSSAAPQTDDCKALSYVIQIIGAGKTPAGVDVPLTFDALLAEALHQARELVDAHQPAIDTLAVSLTEDPLLTGEKLQAALDTAIGRTTKPGTAAQTAEVSA